MKPTYEELERERNELAAQVESLRSAILNAIPFIPGGSVKANLRDAYDETPPVALSVLKAQWQAEAVQSILEEYEQWNIMDLWCVPVVDIQEKLEGLHQRAQEHSNANPNNPPA